MITVSGPLALPTTRNMGLAGILESLASFVMTAVTTAQARAAGVVLLLLVVRFLAIIINVDVVVIAVIQEEGKCRRHATGGDDTTITTIFRGGCRFGMPRPDRTLGRSQPTVRSKIARGRAQAMLQQQPFAATSSRMMTATIVAQHHHGTLCDSSIGMLGTAQVFFGMRRFFVRTLLSQHVFEWFQGIIINFVVVVNFVVCLAGRLVGWHNIIFLCQCVVVYNIIRSVAQRTNRYKERERETIFWQKEIRVWKIFFMFVCVCV
jgi:hypothetical protein